MAAAGWEQMQEKTFTNWVNERLKVQNMAVTNLVKDFADGVVLIVLLEVLSQKKVGSKYNVNERPKMRIQQSANVENALTFIKSEGMRLVNIGAGDIVDGKFKLILGLIWTLILHYQISMGFNINDGDDDNEDRKKQALLKYIQSKIPQKNIKNFTSDWNDGTAIAALVEAHAPGLCPDAETMSPSNPVQNATKAMKLADDRLGIPQVLGPEDMTNPRVDEYSMMTYLSQFPDAHLKDAAIGGAEEPVDPTKVKVSGAGITGKGIKVDSPAPIVIDSQESGVASMSVQVTKPSGEVVDVPMKPKQGSGDKVFEGAYTPSALGKYNVRVNFDGKPLADSPYNVAIGDPLAVRLAGDGLDRAIVSEENVIDIFTDKAGPGDVGAGFVRPHEVPQAEGKLVTVNENHYQIVYTVSEPGSYQVNIKFNDMPVESTPHDITAIDPNRVLVSGPGIKPKGNYANLKTYCDIDATKAGDAETTISVKDPSGVEVPLDLTPTGKNSYHASYKPTQQGDYNVDVKFGGKNVKDAPFKVTVGKPGQVRCYGDGLSGAVVNVPTEFTVDASEVRGGDLGYSFEGPAAKAVDRATDNMPDKPGVHVVKYTIPKPGKYKIHITFNDEEVPGAPFEIVAKDNRGPPNAPKCSVTDIKNLGKFDVDCTQGGGAGLLEVGVKGEYAPADYIAVKHNGDYTFSVSYHISQPGETFISVKWHGEHVDGSPFTVNF